MKRAIALGLLTLFVGLLCIVPATANGSAATHPALLAGSHGSPPSNQPLTAAGTGFTYQGTLTDGGSPANGQYDFTFALFDALTGGNQVGTTVTMLNQTVTNGLFTVTPDFGPGVFEGDARWLQIAVRPTGGGSYTTLAPRQALTAAPYALSLAPGAVINGATGPGGIVLNVNNSGGNSVAGFSGSATDSAIYGVNTNVTSTLGVGIKGEGYYSATGVEGASVYGYGLYGHSYTSPGVFGLGHSAAGIYGTSTSSAGVYGTSSSSYGVEGFVSDPNPAVYGQNTFSGNNGVGGQFLSANSYGVDSQSTTGSGVRGTSNGSGDGLVGNSAGGRGVYGSGVTGVQGIGTVGQGLLGSSTGNDGVFGTTAATNRSGVAGIATGATGGNGVYGTSSTCGSCYAGYFDGRIRATGGCCSGPELNTQIDDPLDPSNKVLNQAAVESPDRVSIYSGNVTTDANGEASVQLPDYASALGGDFRYQLTVIDQFSQAIISSKVKNNVFTIKTDKPNVEVSWQVTAVRQDPYAVAHPIQPEAPKPVTEQGKDLQP